MTPVRLAWIWDRCNWEPRPGLPVRLATGPNTKVSPRELQALGIREQLPKPYDFLVLAAAVNRALITPTLT